ncbi:Bol2p SCDLUD_002303 [Saccharomycodes ludwigii]|uniref:Bol2p n=1 Tax=Saccharomycodes ludwigii TaxID=36035 RepID=UPI001E8882FE|nr:hypothetical protein SCDLUD_002303 [Saccharomycodes ludwigii]KAH3900849.1 hypothetical protein SCDLUD_002303 [Saccharomycodes ludwigii]
MSEQKNIITPELLKSKIEQSLSGNFHEVLVSDMSNGCGQNFEVVVVSDFFLNKNKLVRCRFVNKALAQEISEIHAFSCKCFTIKEWEKIVI